MFVQCLCVIIPLLLGNYESIILRHRAYLVARFADRSVISSFHRASTLTQPFHPRESIDSVMTFCVSQCINYWSKPLAVWLLSVRDCAIITLGDCSLVNLLHVKTKFIECPPGWTFLGDYYNKE